MPVITISRRSFSLGSVVAEKVANTLGYDCISREILLEASEQYNIPEIKLSRAIEISPSILDRLTYSKEKYITYIQSALLRQVRKDNVVYHGLAGHLFLQDISHVLKVHLIADMEDRARLYMEKKASTRKAAMQFLTNLDDQRRKWSQKMYGIDTWDSSNYDLVLHTKNMTGDEAVEIICQAANLPSFQATPGSQRQMEDLFLACEIRAALVDFRPDVKVSSEDGLVRIETTEEDEREREEALNVIDHVVHRIPGVRGTEIKFIPM